MLGNILFIVSNNKPWILEQHFPIELSAVMELFYICTI